MKIILISIAIVLLILWYVIGIKENLKIAFINEEAIKNIKEKNKREISQSLSSPIILMSILLVSFVFMDNKWGSTTYIILLIVVILFIFIEIKNIRKINTKFKNKAIKYKKRNKKNK